MRGSGAWLFAANCSLQKVSLIFRALVKLFNLNDKPTATHSPTTPPLPHLMGSGRGKATDSIFVYARQRFSLGQKNNKPYRKLSAAFLFPLPSGNLPLHSSPSLSLCRSACPCQNHKFYWPNCRANYAANKWPIMKPLSKSAPTN